ncbi:MAG: hypothetical protein J2P57_08500 [Acidimicrobiaceae bacterium]|nr:hypothetical protein [Acidimicrobiaceae bacterium]
MPDELRSRWLQLILREISSARYPSIEMLTRAEAAIDDRETAHNYVSFLLDKVEQDEYPSPVMIDRIRMLIDTLERSAPSEGGSG